MFSHWLHLLGPYIKLNYTDKFRSWDDKLADTSSSLSSICLRVSRFLHKDSLHASCSSNYVLMRGSPSAATFFWRSYAASDPSTTAGQKLDGGSLDLRAFRGGINSRRKERLSGWKHCWGEPAARDGMLSQFKGFAEDWLQSRGLI